MRVGSLFCGCGGSDLGITGGFTYLNRRYRKLPFETAFAIDNDPKAVETYNRNFRTPAIVADIREYEGNLPAIDILVGGFPCQSFSTVNPTKNPHDSRGQLYKEMARFLEWKRPVAFIAENVKGFMLLKKGRLIGDAEREFAGMGYRIKHKLLNAADFGVPQKRERVFIVGIREDLGFCFRFPEETHSENADVAVDGTKKEKWVGLGEVIEDAAKAAPKYFFSKKAVEGMKKAKNNMKRGLYQDLRYPCLTVTSHLAKQSLNSRDPVLLVDPGGELYRRFTPREAARIQSFPDTFEFAGSDQTVYRQIGNAIPPVLMWHLANSLHEQLERAIAQTGVASDARVLAGSAGMQAIAEYSHR